MENTHHYSRKLIPALLLMILGVIVWIANFGTAGKGGDEPSAAIVSQQRESPKSPNHEETSAPDVAEFSTRLLVENGSPPLDHEIAIIEATLKDPRITDFKRELQVSELPRFRIIQRGHSSTGDQVRIGVLSAPSDSEVQSAHARASSLLSSFPLESRKWLRPQLEGILESYLDYPKPLQFLAIRERDGNWTHLRVGFIDIPQEVNFDNVWALPGRNIGFDPAQMQHPRFKLLLEQVR